MTPRGRHATRLLLADIHPDASRFADDEWLAWLYDRNPLGPAIESNHDDARGRLGHVGLVRQRWRRGDERMDTILVVNVATSSESHQPLFASLVASGLSDAFAFGHLAIGWGVTNEQSTGPTRRDLPADQLDTLPVVIARGARPDGVTSTAVDPDTVNADWVRATIGPLAPGSTAGWRQDWTAELLAWRLAAPQQRYVVHVSPDAVAISTHASWGMGVRVGVLLKVIPRSVSVSALGVRRLVGAVRRRHRVAPVVYVGFNRSAPVSGAPVPDRLRPAALNLFAVGGTDLAALAGIPVSDVEIVMSAEAMSFDAFELFDFDAL